MLHELKPRTKIIAGNSNIPLAARIGTELNTSLTKRDLTRFSDGEIRCELLEFVRDNYVFIIQSTSPPVNDMLMELLIMTDALKRQGVSKTVAIVPYFGYSRQDRKPGFSRTPITAKLVADMMQKAGIKRMVTIDIHAEQEVGFFDIPVTNISATPDIVADIWKNHAYDKNFVIVSPDVGGTVRARSVAKQLDNADLAIVDKRRPAANVAQVMNIIGEVEGRRCIIVDDLGDTVGTLAKSAAALKEHGAALVAAYITHPVFSGKAAENLAHPALDEIVTTDTIQLSDEIASMNKIRQISVAKILAETMYRLRARRSISELYTGS